MSSLDELQQILQKLDPDGLLKGIAYEKTFNASLGLANDPADFHVGIPYNPWPAKVSSIPASPKSALVKAFKDILEKGLEGVKGSQGKIVIDITHLHGGWIDFWSAKGGQPKDSLAYALADAVNKLPEKSVPVVRFLIGNSGQEDASQTWPALKKDLQLLFWPNNKPLFEHPYVEFSVGFYNPNFDANLDRATVSQAGSWVDLLQVARTMVDKVYEKCEGLRNAQLDKLHDQFTAQFKDEEVIKQLFKYVVPNVSWNHAKILAVNGKTLLTGGANFWNEYADGMTDISDLHVKIKGDAAISAHTYCDYFWRYLNKPHKTDSYSWRRTARKKNGTLEWDSESDPIDVLPFKRTPSMTTGKAVLSVAKLGDWSNRTADLEYPIQLIDAIRDMILNISWRLLWLRIPDYGPLAMTWFRIFFVEPLADQVLQPSFQKAKITPTAWASRIARTAAIEKAQVAIHIDIQTIAGFLQFDIKQWRDQVDTVNATLKLKGSERWDGILWPYEFIIAITNFMERVKVADEHGVFILLSSDNAKRGGGYEDAVAANEFKQRVRWLINSSETIQDKNLFDKWWNERCTIKRLNFGTTRNNHCKVVCVDKKLLYVGSDNLYPNYNEEYGVWVDDKPAIDAWYNQYWTPRWNGADKANMDVRAGSKFEPTMIYSGDK